MNTVQTRQLMLMLLALKIKGRNEKHQMISLCTVVSNIFVIKYYVDLSQKQQSLEHIHCICFGAINFLVAMPLLLLHNPLFFVYDRGSYDNY